MKKFPITKFYFNLFLVMFVIFLLLTVFYARIIIKIFSEDGSFLGGYITIAVHAFGTIWMLRALFFTFFGGKVSVDHNGFAMYIGWKKYCYTWDVIPCCGVVDVDVGSAGNDIDTYWVYLNSRYLSADERRRFLRNANRYAKTMVFFQYDPELVELALQYAPEALRTQLKQLPRPRKWKRSPISLSKH